MDVDTLLCPYCIEESNQMKFMAMALRHEAELAGIIVDDIPGNPPNGFLPPCIHQRSILISSVFQVPSSDLDKPEHRN